jgi:L-fucose isomerase-like protein
MSDHVWTRAIEKPVQFGVFVTSRAFFNAAHATNARTDLTKQLDTLKYPYFIMDASATPNGAVETLADAKKYAAFFKEHRDEIDGIIVSLANFGDEIAVVETLQRSGLDVPILIQACNDDLTHVDVKGRRDAYCGKLSVCNNLYQCGIPWTDTTEHTEDIDSDLFRKDLDKFGRICRTVKGLRNARIGAIGARPGPFRTVRYSEKLLQAGGISVTTVDLSEILGNAGRISKEDAAVKEKLDAIHSYGKIPNVIVEHNIFKQAALSVAIDRWMEENECDASAIQCWDSVQNNYGCATCLSMSMMGEKLMPSACETDVTGVISMYALALATGNAPGFLDWNNNYGHEKDMVVGTHCSNFPKSFMGAEIEISNLDILGETIGQERCFGAVKGHVAPGDFTFFRMSTDDRRGEIRGYVGEGTFTDDPFPMDGGIAVCRIPNVRNLMRHITKNGFEHHVAMARGMHSDVLEESIETYLGWNLYAHNRQD